MRSPWRLVLALCLSAPLVSGAAEPPPPAAAAPAVPGDSASAAPVQAAAVAASGVAPATERPPRVVLETTQGTIVLELYPDKAPITVANFLKYVDARFYNGTIFHRVIPGFMVQGGGFTKDLLEKPTRAPIKNEATNGLSNMRGTVAMARTNYVDSATAQFFVNVIDNDFLDHHDDANQYGYTVFGRVVEGMGAVDAMVRAERLCPSDSKDPCTAALPPKMRDVPKVPIMIVKAFRMK